MTSEALTAGEIVVLVSVDTEEDNWTPARERITTENIRELPQLNARFERLGMRPTYFVTHSVAVNTWASRIIAAISDCDFAEIGAHLHPWNTPPLDESMVPRHTMLLNLPASLQRAKLECLTVQLQQCLGRRPTSFRAGRWGLGTEAIGALLDCGYTVDSSVTPYTSWTSYDEGADHRGAPVTAYHLDRGADVRKPVSGGRLTEIPASFGFNRSPLAFWGALHRALSSRVGRALMLDRIAASTGLLRHVSLSPETDRVDEMVDLTNALLASGARHLHLYLHSPSLCPGLTPFVKTANDLARFHAAIEEYLDRITAFTNVRFATVAEAASLLASDPRANTRQSDAPRYEASRSRSAKTPAAVTSRPAPGP